MPLVCEGLLVLGGLLSHCYGSYSLAVLLYRRALAMSFGLTLLLKMSGLLIRRTATVPCTTTASPCSSTRAQDGGKCLPQADDAELLLRSVDIDRALT